MPSQNPSGKYRSQPALATATRAEGARRNSASRSCAWSEYFLDLALVVGQGELLDRCSLGCLAIGRRHAPKALQLFPDDSHPPVSQFGAGDGVLVTRFMRGLWGFAPQSQQTTAPPAPSRRRNSTAREPKRPSDLYLG